MSEKLVCERDEADVQVMTYVKVTSSSPNSAAPVCTAASSGCVSMRSSVKDGITMGRILTSTKSDKFCKGLGVKRRSGHLRGGIGGGGRVCDGDRWSLVVFRGIRLIHDV